MADTKISALTAITPPLAAAAQFAINDAGTSKRVTAEQIKDFIETSPVFAAGSASAGSWPIFTPGTLLTTAEDGAFELDATNFYLTTDGGNRGYVPVRHLIRNNATRTFTSNVNEQALFTTPTNGRLTLETGIYRFEGMILIGSMSATSGNCAIDLLGAGTATITRWAWMAVGNDAAAAAAGAAAGGSWHQTQQSGASIVTPATGTGVSVNVQGTFDVTAGGTLIPSMTMVTAAASVLQIGSYLLFERIGATNTSQAIGQWD